MAKRKAGKCTLTLLGTVCEDWSRGKDGRCKHSIPGGLCSLGGVKEKAR